MFTKNSLIISSLLFLLLLDWGHANAQCATQVTGNLAEFHFNANPVSCTGANSPSPLRPLFKGDIYTYCPNESLGCGNFLLGSRGHANTAFFENGICALNFYDVATASGRFGGTADYDPNSTTFDPESPANFYLLYTVPAGGGSCISEFSILPVQYMYDGSTVNFEKMGVAVYRNGLLIHTEEQNIAASNVNGTPLNFSFSGSQFCADGNQATEYEVVFGYVHQLVSGGALSPGQSGIDDIILRGTCSQPKSSYGFIQPATCTSGGGAASNGKMFIYGFDAADRFDFSLGNTYTGAATFASATPIPADGILSTTLPNPSQDTTYTVRLINSDDCTYDFTIKMKATSCPVPCDEPTGETISTTNATCSGLTSDDNATIQITGVTNGDRVGIFAGAPYAGNAYGTASNLSGGAFTFTGLPNPTSNQIYTVRIFNATDACYVDRQVEIFENACGPCSNGSLEILESGEDDPDSTPNNSDASEDDIAFFEVCHNTDNIDLALTKNVSPTTGTVNTTFVYTLTLSNSGTMTAKDIQVNEDFPFSVAPSVLNGTLGSTPDSLSIQSATPTVGTFGLAQGWILDSLQAGQSATLTINLRAMFPGTYNNCAYVTNMSPDNDPDSTDDNDETANEDDDDCASITVTGTSLPSIVKEFSPMLTKPNTPTRLTLKIKNPEITPITLSSALVDVFPTTPAQMSVATPPNLVTNLTGISLNANDTQISIPSGTVLPSGLSQISFDVVVPSAGDYCNTIAAGDLQTSIGNNLLPTDACIKVNSSFVMPPVISVGEVCINSANEVQSLTITIDNRNASSMTLDQDFINYLPDGLVMATGSNTGTIAGVSAFSAGDTTFTLPAGSTIASGQQTIVVPVTSNTAGKYNNIVYMNAILTSVDGFSDIGNQDIAEATTLACINPTITTRDSTICTGQMVDVATLASTTAGTLTFHSATPPDAGNQLTSTTISPSADSIIYVLATDATCSSIACSSIDSIMIIYSTPEMVTLCEDASNSATITAQAGLTGIEWFNSADVSVGTGDSIIIDANTAGLSDGTETFYYTATDGTGCNVGLCCPIVVTLESCCPAIALDVPNTQICAGDSTTLTVNFDSIAGNIALYHSTTLLDSASINAAGHGGATFIDSTQTGIVINEVDYIGGESVELWNTSCETVDISNWSLCYKFGYNDLNAATISSGDLMLSPGEKVVFSDLPNITMNNSPGSLGLYRNNTDFGDAANMVDYVQWGAGGQARESVAVSKGIWTTGDFINAIASGNTIQYDGYGDSAADWGFGAPTFGATNVNTNHPLTTMVSSGALSNNTSSSITYYFYAILSDASCNRTASCQPVAIDSIVVNPIPVISTTDADICEGLSINLNTLVTNVNNTTMVDTAYFMTLQNAIDSTAAIASVVSPTTTTEYYIRLSTNTSPSCYDIDSLTITVNDIIPVVSTTCDDNGTGGDTNDDTFTISVTATNTSAGASNQYIILYNGNTLNIGGTDYGSPVTVSHPDFVANGVFSPMLSIQDVDDVGCAVMITVSAVSACSTCPPQICLPIKATAKRGIGTN